MKSNYGVVAAVVGVVLAITAYASFYTVDMTEQALVLQFGDPRGQPITEPGLHVKLPFIQNVVYVDKRLLDLDSPTEEIIAEDRKRLVVDAFARYRIVDALKFYQSVGDQMYATNRLQPLLVSALRNVIGDNSLEELVRDNRAGLMQQIRDTVNKATQEFGVEVVDVRIRRADLPEANSQAIYRRMQTEREREAAELRAQGQEFAQTIRSKADRDVTVFVADAERDAQSVRGEGDAEANRVAAEAYSQDPEFYAFYRSMAAYSNALKGDNTTMVLDPSSDFFRYFNANQATAGKR
ncbi:MAG: protease modulator HflC [Parvibaculaceae bacterium]|nr:protease modulator HflC [Parvibaculaceae bacterium]